MQNLVILLGCLALLMPNSRASTIGTQSTGTSFCYRESEGCGPNSAAWDPLCHTGQLQSPINLMAGIPSAGAVHLNIGIYKGDSFRMINNGHSVQVDFDNKGPSTQTIILPDPLHIRDSSFEREYKFASAHFHWGVSDFATGSEHCIFGICNAMEAHFVHYLSKYASQAEAVNSGDVNALAVIGVLIDVSPIKTIENGLVNALTQHSITNGTGPLGPIVNNLHKVATADHTGLDFVTVNETLDLGGLLKEPHLLIYTYKGSLTTPGCNEQVNWYVVANPATTSHQDLEAFRTILKDGNGKTLDLNHRPLQHLNGRPVYLSILEIKDS